VTGAMPSISPWPGLPVGGQVISEASAIVSRGRQLALRVEAVGKPSNSAWLELLDFDLHAGG